MKFLLLLLLVTPCLGQSIESRVKAFEDHKDFVFKYDKFKTETQVNFHDYVRVRGQYPLSLMGIVIIDDEGENTSFGLFLSSNRTLYKRATLRLMLDGELLEIPNNEIEYTIYVRFNRQQMNRLVNAKIVELQLASWEGKLDNDTLKKLKELASLLN